LNYKLNTEKILLTSNLWKLNNRNKIKEYRKSYYDNNREQQITYSINYTKNNPKAKEYQKNYNKNNPKRKEYQKEYKKYHKLKNPHIYAWRLTLSNVLKRFDIKKNNKTIKLLGYSAYDLKEHLESKFLEGMSWDNRNEWHIDHIKPVSSFDKNEKMSVVNSLENLQPLWAKDNLSKGSKII
jgi:hypothetical protein